MCVCGIIVMPLRFCANAATPTSEDSSSDEFYDASSKLSSQSSEVEREVESNDCNSLAHDKILSDQSLTGKLARQVGDEQ